MEMQNLGTYADAESHVLEEPVQEKPIFWHSLHKRMWNLVSLGMTEREALHCIRAEDNLPDTWRPLNDCFACEAASECVHAEGTGCAVCPLVWGDSETSSRHCMRGVCGKWTVAALYGMKDRARELACEIRDVPFSDAINLYEVK